MILFIGAYAAVLLSQILNEPLWGLALLLAANTVAFFLISDTARKQILETLAVFWTTIRFSLRIAGREPQL
jgi:hypothetical protein